MNERIYRINELVTNDNNLDLLQDVNRYYMEGGSLFDFKMYVAGSSNYGNGLQKYSKPHFHVIIENGFKFDKMRIFIPSTIEWNKSKKLNVIESTIKDYNNIIDKITIWMDIIHKGSFGDISNLDELISFWNLSNQDNKNVELI